MRRVTFSAGLYRAENFKLIREAAKRAAYISFDSVYIKEGTVQQAMIAVGQYLFLKNYAFKIKLVNCLTEL